MPVRALRARLRSGREYRPPRTFAVSPDRAHADHAQVWFKRGERIVCNLRPGCGNARNQGRLAGVRKTDQADVGEQFQLQAQSEFVAGLAVFMLGWGLMRRGREPGVAFSARPPCATMKRSPATVKSCSTSPVSAL